VKRLHDSNSRFLRTTGIRFLTLSGNSDSVLGELEIKQQRLYHQVKAKKGTIIHLYSFSDLENIICPPIKILKLYSEGKIKSAFVLDFDLHTGDGNINILSHREDDFRVKILNPDSYNNKGYIREVEEYMDKLENIDIFAASAGFDQGIDDWGHLLYPEDYTELGRLMKVYSEKLCGIN